VNDLVTVAETGMSAESLREAGVEIVPDWRGRPAVSMDAAGKLLADRAAATAEHEARWRQHQLDNEQWLADRAMAGRAAGERAVKGRRRGSGTAYRYRCEYLQGSLAYQRRYKRPEWNGKPTLPDAVLYTEEDAVPGGGTAADDHRWSELGVAR
jgi:hypothetical protein